LSDSIGSVVYLTDTVGAEHLQGSGVLISPDEVLTAAHVVWSTAAGLATVIDVTPDYDADGGSKAADDPYGTVSGVVTHYNAVDDSGDVISNADSQDDFALVKLSSDVAAAGTMALGGAYLGPFNSPINNATVTGYPASAGGQQISKTETLLPYSEFNAAPILGGGNYSLLVGQALGAGSSGGPAWVTGPFGPTVVGLVSSADTSGDLFLTEITTSVFDTIETWMAQDAAACFLQGTRIATVRGAVPIEALTLSDIVLAHFAGPSRIRWLGRHTVECSRHPRPETVWPVRVRAHALGPAQPSRDLFLSPDHAVFVAGSLIPVRYLINGASIVREPRATAVYWHVELARHDVLMAENLPAESYLDTGNRGAFEPACLPLKDVA
jgi:hypothetical protein